MKDARSREPVVRQFLHPLNRHPVPLAASPERASPEVADVVAEGLQCPKIRRNRVVVEESRDNLRQPSPLFGDRLMPAMSQLLRDLRKLGLHAVAATFPLEQEFA